MKVNLALCTVSSPILQKKPLLTFLAPVLSKKNVHFLQSKKCQVCLQKKPKVCQKALLFEDKAKLIKKKTQSLCFF